MLHSLTLLQYLSPSPSLPLSLSPSLPLSLCLSLSLSPSVLRRYTIYSETVVWEKLETHSANPCSVLKTSSHAKTLYSIK